MKNYQEFYKQMGNLLYSIAAIDGKIAPKELKELRRMVREELVPQEKHNDEFGTDAAFAVEFQFDVLEGSDAPSSDAWDEAKEYLKHNSALLPEKDRNLLMHGAEHVAAAFHGISKAEHVLLDKLKVLLAVPQHS
ncbi:MAG TPA: TerB family tellurite resistance protein [Catalimonadaceae bacterium]|nr:TerB family tellurite resistance protein [Catalimonadaceae bacterium]HPI11383.1 TerB family tellurite resistance protein [Catalimonadaceae bacterium]